jgi:hypothetical protein
LNLEILNDGLCGSQFSRHLPTSSNETTPIRKDGSRILDCQITVA